MVAVPWGSGGRKAPAGGSPASGVHPKVRPSTGDPLRGVDRDTLRRIRAAGGDGQLRAEIRTALAELAEIVPPEIDPAGEPTHVARALANAMAARITAERLQRTQAALLEVVTAPPDSPPDVRRWFDALRSRVQRILEGR